MHFNQLPILEMEIYGAVVTPILVSITILFLRRAEKFCNLFLRRTDPNPVRHFPVIICNHDMFNNHSFVILFWKDYFDIEACKLQFSNLIKFPFNKQIWFRRHLLVQRFSKTLKIIECRANLEIPPKLVNM